MRKHGYGTIGSINIIQIKNQIIVKSSNEIDIRDVTLLTSIMENNINIYNGNISDSQYRIALDKNLTGNKGAGLGLLLMARKSKNKLKYNFKKDGHGKFKFNLEITVNILNDEIIID